MAQKNYTNGDITVSWKPDLCIHSTNCVNGLAEVFNPQARPWVNMQGATSERIIAQVERCPSGALSYFRNAVDETSENVSVEMLVEVLPDGPLVVHGSLHIKGIDGNESKRAPKTAFCRCGASHNKPFCDGSHRAANFKDD
ncbi:MAG: (4Fe-4S)-binding protein [Acidobacteriota bacterium]